LRKLEHIKSIIKRSKAAGEIHVSPTLRTLLLNNKKKEQQTPFTTKSRGVIQMSSSYHKFNHQIVQRSKNKNEILK
jgi:hypothetical protein